MPKAQNASFYDAVYSLTAAAIGGGEAANERYRIRLEQNTAIYRYASGTVSDGAEGASRKIWSTLAQDTLNRWTGSPPPGATCTDASTGLYVSLEAQRGADTVFSELFHYQSQENGDKHYEILFQEFLAHSNAEVNALGVKKLFYMFTYNLESAMSGWDLNIDSPLIRKIHDNLREQGALPKEKNSLKDMYCQPDDCDFCRAIGNCCLAKDPSFLYVTSTRDEALKSINVIFEGPGGRDTDPMPYLKPQGRASFYVTPLGTETAVTVEDMSYNAQFG